jgi:hypothetical protein
MAIYFYKVTSELKEDSSTKGYYQGLAQLNSELTMESIQNLIDEILKQAKKNFRVSLLSNDLLYSEDEIVATIQSFNKVD